MKPALTKEEWADPRPARSLTFTGDTVENECCGCALPSRHALAALALHGQPFGFRWEDVEWLRELIDSDENPETAPVEFNAACRSLADRIEALLPPEGP